MTLALAVLGAIAWGMLAYYWKADQIRIKRRFDEFVAQEKQRELEQRQAESERKQKQEQTAHEADLTRARNRQNEVRAQAQQATNVLGHVLSGLQRLQSEAIALRSSEAGRKVGLYSDLVAAARQFYDADLRMLPVVGEVMSKLENARRVEQQMAASLGTTYEPEAGFATALQSDILWSAAELRRVERCQSLLTGLVQAGNANVAAPTMSPEPATLEAAMTQLAQTESLARERSIAEAVEQAKPHANQLSAEAERERIMQEARLQATNVVNAMRVQFEEQHREQMIINARLQSQLLTAQLQVSNVVLEMAVQRRDFERKAKQGEAEQHKLDVVAEIQRQDLLDEARNMELRRKAQDPHLQALLAPFTTPGYRQYKTMTGEKLPLSYTQLQSMGALSPNVPGLSRLAELAMSDAYRERPRWHLRGGSYAWQNFPESMDQVREAQNALIELGPVLVELKMLAP